MGPLHRRSRLFGSLAALAALIGACQPFAGPTVLPGSPSTTIASSPGALARQAASDVRWTQIRPPSEPEVSEAGPAPSSQGCAECPADTNSTMSGITVGPAGLVAVGWIYQGFHGAVWRSTDGTSWSLDDPLPEDTSLQAVAADANRYVAVGLDGRGATAWTSSDGRLWEKVVPNGAFGTVPLRITSVVHWENGFVAAGYVGTEFGTADAAFWVSADGMAWRRAPDSPDLHDARPSAIVAGGPGLVAVGSSGATDAPGPAVIWTSSDGLHWSRATANPAFDGARIRSIANVPGIGLVAVGDDLARDSGAAWTSADGVRWTRSPNYPDLGGQGLRVHMYGVVAGGPGVVAVGAATDGGDQQYADGAVWTSPDGVDWRREPSGAEFVAGDLLAVTASGRGLVAVGDTGAPDDYVPSVWLATGAGRS